MSLEMQWPKPNSIYDETSQEAQHMVDFPSLTCGLARALCKQSTFLRRDLDKFRSIIMQLLSLCPMVAYQLCS